MDLKDNDQKLLKIISQTQSTRQPRIKTIQKIVYILQIKGEELGYDYGMGYYGPYCDDLAYTLRYSWGCGYLELQYKDGCNLISCIDVPDIELSPAVVDVINKLAAKTDEELELLATVLYINQRLKDAADDDIIYYVKHISGDRFDEKTILESIGFLESSNL